jgi:hypothetical protein
VSFLIDAKFGGQIFSGTNAGAVGRRCTKRHCENGLTVDGIDDARLIFTTTVEPENLATYWGRIQVLLKSLLRMLYKLSSKRWI